MLLRFSKSMMRTKYQAEEAIMQTEVKGDTYAKRFENKKIKRERERITFRTNSYGEKITLKNIIQ